MKDVGQKFKDNDLYLLLLLATIRFLIHLLTNGQYGFHRDALAFLDHGRHLDWGYVAYPPLTPFIGRIAQVLFGLSLVGVRAFAALAQCVGMVVAGLMAKALGGGRRAQIVTAVAAAIAPMSVIMSVLFQYISFDYLWWVLIAYGMIRLLKSQNPRWWLFIGVFIGLGAMTKYTIAFYIAGLVAGVLLTNNRRYLTSPWLWGGVGLAVLIFLPNLIWQIQHQFISLEFLDAIHTRDVAIGRAEGYFSQQLYVNANPFTLPLWIAGLYFYFSPQGARYRPLGYMYAVPLILFWLAEGRFYYMAPAYPMLLAAGAVVGERWVHSRSAAQQRLIPPITYGLLTVGAAISAFLMMPLAPVHSAAWEMVSEVHDNFTEQIGWEDLTATVAGIYTAEAESSSEVVGILAGNYGVAAALNLYGPQYNLPPAISPVNSYWYRGYGTPTLEVVVAVGFTAETLAPFFGDCTQVGEVTNQYGVENDEYGRPIFVCRELLAPWEEIWPQVQSFG